MRKRTDFICGVSPPEAEDPDATDFEIDYRFYEEVVWPTLAQRDIPYVMLVLTDFIAAPGNEKQAARSEACAMESPYSPT